MCNKYPANRRCVEHVQEHVQQIPLQPGADTIRMQTGAGDIRINMVK
jgi:hypothetical protein